MDCRIQLGLVSSSGLMAGEGLLLVCVGSGRFRGHA